MVWGFSCFFHLAMFDAQGTGQNSTMMSGMSQAVKAALAVCSFKHMWALLHCPNAHQSKRVEHDEIIANACT